MSIPFDLLQFVQFIKQNIKYLISNKTEQIIYSDSYIKFNWVSSNTGHQQIRTNFIKYIDYVQGNLARRDIAYSLYFHRLNKWIEIQSFFIYMGEDSFTSAKNFAAIICAILNNPIATNEEIAQSIDETFIRKKRSGISITLLDGLIVEDEINVNNEWQLKPIIDEDLTYEAHSYTRSNDRLDNALLRALSKIEIPFNVDLVNGIPIPSGRDFTQFQIIAFLRLYKVGGVEVICSCSKINSLLEEGGINSTTSSSYPKNTYKITKSDESSINELWRELKEILPPSSPPYELLKREKIELRNKITQNKNLSDLEIKKIKHKLYLDEAKFKTAWISQAIYTRYSFASPSDEERVHHIASALESVLVLDKNDTSYKFKTRGAGILQLMGSQSGSTIFSILGTIYDVRSKYAHGGRVEKLESIEISNKYGPIYARNLIILYYLYIKDKLGLTISDEEKEKILGKNFQILIEHSLFDKQKRSLLEQFVGKYQHLLIPIPAE